MRRTIVAVCTLLITAAAPPPKSEPVTLTGTVVPLTEVLKSHQLNVDNEPLANQVVLKGDDGTITPLLSDDASRALFKDERLRHRRTEVKGLRFPGLPYLRVVSFKVEDEGRLRTPEYYCDVCAISVRFPQICPCCQGNMILRMQAERP
jgi:hypothetical protein